MPRTAGWESSIGGSYVLPGAWRCDKVGVIVTKKKSRDASKEDCAMREIEIPQLEELRVASRTHQNLVQDT